MPGAFPQVCSAEGDSITEKIPLALPEEFL